MEATETIRIISAKREPVTVYLKKVWQYRSLIVTLARRDLKIKYAQTMLGILWSVLQPLTGLLIFTIFFDRLIKIDTLGIPYPLFAFTGMVSWFFFSYIIGSAGLSLTNAQDLIKKVYFPKLVLPLSKVLVGFTEFAISFVLLFIMMLLLGYYPQIQILTLPIFILLNILVGLSVAIWLSALTIRYRDFHHIIPYVINFGIWLTPVFYPGTLIPEQFNWFLFLNPMAGVIAGFRWSLIGDMIPSLMYLLGLVPVIFFFLTGIWYFVRVENEIADLI